jgi:hypothetical protein
VERCVGVLVPQKEGRFVLDLWSVRETPRLGGAYYRLDLGVFERVRRTTLTLAG